MSATETKIVEPGTQIPAPESEVATTPDSALDLSELDGEPELDGAEAAEDDTEGAEADGEPEAEPTEADDYTHREQAHYQAILDMRRTVAKLRDKFEAAKESASAAKKRWESAVEEHGALMDRGPEAPDPQGPDPQGTLPFGKDADGADADGADGAAENNTSEPDESWRGISIAELELSQVVNELLRQSSFLSLGMMVDYSAEYHGWTTVNGIGPAKNELIENAFIDFWKEHPEFCEPTEPTED